MAPAMCKAKSYLTAMHRILFCALHPLLRWVSGKHIPYTHKWVTGVDYYELKDLLKPGHIFLTRIRGELTTLIIPGHFSHAAIYTPNNTHKIPESVTEAEGVGVINTDLVTFLTSKDEVLVLEPVVPEDKKQRIMELAAQTAYCQLGKPYDFDFLFQQSTQQAFYCSELVWWSYAVACAAYDAPCPFVAKDELGEPTVSPQNIADDKIHFKVIYQSRRSK